MDKDLPAAAEPLPIKEWVFRRPGRFVVVMAATAGLAYFLRLTSDVFAPLAVAAVLSLAAYPTVAWMVRHRVPHWLAVSAVVMAALILLAAVGLLVEQSVGRFVEQAPQFEKQGERLWGRFRERLGLPGTPALGDARGAEMFRTVVGIGGATALSVGGVLLEIVVVTLYLVFLLMGRRHFPALIEATLGKGVAHRASRALSEVESELLRYFILRTLVSVGSGVAVWAILAAYGVEFAVLWGLLTFVAQYIPFIGPISASILPVLMAVVQFPGIATALWILLWLTLLHVAVGFVVEPRIFSVGMRLNQTLVLLGLALMGWMWGIVGVLLWVPLLSALKMAAGHSHRLRPLVLYLGPTSDLSSGAKEG